MDHQAAALCKAEVLILVKDNASGRAILHALAKDTVQLVSQSIAGADVVFFTDLQGVRCAVTDGGIASDGGIPNNTRLVNRLPLLQSKTRCHCMLFVCCAFDDAFLKQRHAKFPPECALLFVNDMELLLDAMNKGSLALDNMQRAVLSEIFPHTVSPAQAALAADAALAQALNEDFGDDDDDAAAGNNDSDNANVWETLRVFGPPDGDDGDGPHAETPNNVMRCLMQTQSVAGLNIQMSGPGTANVYFETSPAAAIAANHIATRARGRGSQPPPPSPVSPSSRALPSPVDVMTGVPVMQSVGVRRRQAAQRVAQQQAQQNLAQIVAEPVAQERLKVRAHDDDGT